MYESPPKKEKKKNKKKKKKKPQVLKLQINSQTRACWL